MNRQGFALESLPLRAGRMSRARVQRRETGDRDVPAPARGDRVKNIRVIRKDLGTVVWKSAGPVKDHVADRVVENLRRNISEKLFTIEVDVIEERPPNWVELDPLAT